MKFQNVCMHDYYFLTISYLEMLRYFKVQVLNRYLVRFPFHVIYYKVTTHSEHVRKLLTEASAQKYSSSNQQVFCKISVLETFAELIGKHLCQDLFFNKVPG